MRVLALETSGRVGSIALLTAPADGPAAVVAAQALPPGERSAQTLLPAVKRLLAEQQWRPADLGLIATTTGPGSFTGLRIGVVAAKTLAYALRTQLVGVHTLAAMALAWRQCIASTPPAEAPARLWTVLDAQRQELFAACFERGSDLASAPAPPTSILAVDDWLGRLAPGDAVTGPPLSKLLDRLPAGAAPLPASEWSPSASATGLLAIELERRGHTTAPLSLAPNYYRKSAAEEKAAL